MSKTLKNLMALAQREDATAAELLGGLQDADAELRSACLAAQQAEKNYNDSLLDPNDEVLPRLDDARRSVKILVDRVKGVQAALQNRLAAAQEADQRAAVDQLHAAADAAAAAYREAVTVDLPLVIAAVRGMLRLGAEAEIARLAAIEADRTRPARPPIDAFRASPDRPRKNLSKVQEADHWCRPNGERLAENLQDSVLVASDGSGFLRTGNGSTRLNHKRRFRRVEVLEAEFGRAAEPLSKTLSVPGISALDQPGWRSLDSSDPHAILAALARLERHVEPESDTRQPKVIFEPAGDLIEVGRSASVIENLAGRRAS